MLRIASGNGSSVRELCAWLRDNKQILALDWLAHDNPLINSIAGSVGVDKETVIQCLPSSLYGLFGKRISETQWLWTHPGSWRVWEGTSDRHFVNQYCPTVFWNRDIISLNGLSLSIVAACGTSAFFENDVLTVESYFGLHHGF